MEQRTAQRVEGWPARRFDGGYAGLHDLAAEEFSGAVGAPGGGWLLMTGGRVVGVPEGGIERFEDGGGGPAHAAPEPALPLLFAMQESGGETRGEYYTEQTPLSEVDATLREGGFTGYVELSENVLSGDYYLVYHAGERDAVAYIGNAGRLKTGEEAFERAADEVGIYVVTAVDVTVTEIPGEGPSAAAGTVGTAGNGADAGPDTSETTEATGTDGEDPSAPEPSAGDPAGGGAATAHDAEPDHSVGTGAAVEGTDPDADRSPADAGSTGKAGGTGDAGGADGATDTAGDAGGGPTPAAPEREGLIPAVRPVDGAGAGTGAEGEAGEAGDTGSDTAVADEGATATAVSRLRDRVSELQRERDRLQERLESATTERDRLQERLESTAAERDQLQERAAELESTVDRLQDRIEQLEAATGDTDGGRLEPMEPARALAGTNLFVRYGSKSEATLEDAHEGGLNHETVSRNLGLEHHTEFDSATVSVGGEPFEPFLESSTEYRFVRWLLTELLYEIRDTENVQAMQELYDALPEIDRAELHASVEAGGSEQEFDVVLRDRVGDPLAVANLSASRDPTTAADLEALVDGAGAVAGEASLVGAFLVTASYFEPDALEAAEAASNSGGLLSRSKRASYVKRGGGGFHLCLVEARDRRFHVVMPDL
jgi:prefoldin subunit 5